MKSIACPRKIVGQISTQPVGAEVLLYDERRHQAFCLNATSAAIWELCDGRRTVAQIVATAQAKGMMAITEDMVLVAVDQLQADGLVEDDTPWMPIPELSRRQMLQRLATGAVVLLPGVAAVMAPKAAQAYNGCVNCSALMSQEARRKKELQQWQYMQKSKQKPSAGLDSSEAARQLFKP